MYRNIVEYKNFNFSERPSCNADLFFITKSENNTPIAYFQDRYENPVYVPDKSIIKNWFWTRLELVVTKKEIEGGNIEYISFNFINSRENAREPFPITKMPWLGISHFYLNKFIFEKFSSNHK